MSNEILYKGSKYILESEFEEEPEEDDIIGGEKYVSPKEIEADNEFEKSDRIKQYVNRNYKELEEIVNTLYYKYVSRYSTASEMKNLLRAIYEIIAKRYIEAKQSGRFEYVSKWEQLIHNIPHIAVLEEEYSYDPVDEMVKSYYYIIKTPMYATAFIMAITQRLNELASQDETGENEFDEIKERLDTQLNQIIH